MPTTIQSQREKAQKMITLPSGATFPRSWVAPHCTGGYLIYRGRSIKIVRSFNFATRSYEWFLDTIEVCGFCEQAALLKWSTRAETQRCFDSPLLAFEAGKRQVDCNLSANR